MAWGRAILFSALLYIITFLVGILLSMLFELSPSSVSDIPRIFWYIQLLITVILVFLFTRIYFASEKTTARTQNGFLLGLSMVAVGFILDGLSAVPSILAGQTHNLGLLFAYYQEPVFIGTLLLIIAAATGTGFYLERNYTPSSTSP